MAAAVEGVVQRWFTDGLNGADWNATKDIFADSFVYHGADSDLSADDLRARVEGYRSTYPELLFGIDRMVCQGDVVGISWHAVTRNGTAWGIGRGRVDDGQLAEVWAVMPPF